MRHLLAVAVAGALAGASAAQAEPADSVSICQNVGGKRVCASVTSSDAEVMKRAVEAAKSAVGVGQPSEQLVRYDRTAEARKARPDAPAPFSSTLCPPPYRMTLRDGCQ